jgi:hypothetical protein
VATLALVLGLLTPPLSTTGAQAFECPNEEVIHTGDLALTTQSAVDAIAAAPFTTIHVWTAPALQELLEHFGWQGRLQPCIRP